MSRFKIDSSDVKARFAATAPSDKSSSGATLRATSSAPTCRRSKSKASLILIGLALFTTGWHSLHDHLNHQEQTAQALATVQRLSLIGQAEEEYTLNHGGFADRETLRTTYALGNKHDLDDVVIAIDKKTSDIRIASTRTLAPQAITDLHLRNTYGQPCVTCTHVAFDSRAQGAIGF